MQIPLLNLFRFRMSSFLAPRRLAKTIKHVKMTRSEWEKRQRVQSK